MNSNFFKVIIALILFLTLSSNAQNTNYERIRLKNTEYYLYTVQAGEGLYSISKNFNVTQAEIIELNPQTASGLKSGEKIVIPITSKSGNIITSSQTSNSNQPVTFVEHIVVKKQTIYGISQQYSITQEELIKHNPSITEGLREGMKLRIPSLKGQKETINQFENKAENRAIAQNTVLSNRNEEKVGKQEPVEKIIHEVKSKETLYAISKLYNVKIEDIIELNPGAEQKIKRGMELTIPTKKFISKAIVPTTLFTEHKVLEKETLYSISKLYNIDIEEIITYNPSTEKKLRKGSKLQIPVTDSKNIGNNKLDASINIDSINNAKTASSDSAKKTKPIRISFLLPFMVQNAKVEAPNDRFIEFYSGALIAINDAKKKGLSFDIYTYDTEKSEEKVIEILKNPVLKNMDLIIGPAYTNQISYISDFSKDNKINTLVPFSSKVLDIATNPYLFQFNPNMNVETEFLAEVLTDQYKNENIVFLEIDGVNNMDEGNEFAISLMDELRKNRVVFRNKMLFSEQTIENNGFLSTDKKNILIFNSDKLTSVNPYLSAIKNLNSNCEIIIFEQNNWQLKSNKSYKALKISPFKPTLTSSEYNKFTQSFSEIFTWKISNTDPRYDILGYDLTNYFINLISNDGHDLSKNKQKLQTTTGIQSQFKFQRNFSYQGFVNKHLYYTVD